MSVSLNGNLHVQGDLQIDVENQPQHYFDYLALLTGMGGWGMFLLVSANSSHSV